MIDNHKNKWTFYGNPVTTTVGVSRNGLRIELWSHSYVNFYFNGKLKVEDENNNVLFNLEGSFDSPSSNSYPHWSKILKNKSIKTYLENNIPSGQYNFKEFSNLSFNKIYTVEENKTDPDGREGNLNYSWLISGDNTNWKEVSTKNTYKSSSADKGKKLKVKISYKDNDNFSESFTTSKIDIGNNPVITGPSGSAGNSTSSNR